MLRERICGAAFAAALGLVLTVAPARAGVEDGIAAFHNGDYVTAYAEFEAIRAHTPVNPPVMRPPNATAPKPRAAAEYYLSRMYLEGRGVAADPDAGLNLLRRAAHQEYPAALVAMSERYRVGEGVMQNRREAQRMMRRAVALGDGQAVELWNLHYQEDPAPDLADLRERGEIPDYIELEREPVATGPRALPSQDRLASPLPSRRANDIVDFQHNCPTSACGATVN